MKNKLFLILALPGALCQGMSQDRKRSLSPDSDQRNVRAHVALANTSTADDELPSHDDLHCAAASGDIDALEYLLNDDADVNAEDSEHCTPLDHAAKNGHLAAVKLLIERSATVNRCLSLDGYCYQPEALHWAVAQHRYEVAAFLLSHGADPDLVSGDEHETTLAIAVECDDPRMVQLLLDRGANINLRGGWGKTPLHHAANKGNLEIGRLLVARGAQLDLCDGSPESYTPLQAAIYERHDDFVEFLINAGATVDAVTPGRFGALQQAMRCNNRAIAAKLIAKGADVRARNAFGATLLHEAARVNATQCAELLLARRADVNAETQQRVTPLDIALECDSTETAEMLIEHGAEARGNAQAVSDAVDDLDMDDINN